jgi:hypothetical protein
MCLIVSNWKILETEQCELERGRWPCGADGRTRCLVGSSPPHSSGRSFLVGLEPRVETYAWVKKRQRPAVYNPCRRSGPSLPHLQRRTSLQREVAVLRTNATAITSPGTLTQRRALRVRQDDRQ